jgi:transposase
VRRNHTREFKLQCCRQVATGEKRPAQKICREHNLSERACSLEVAQGVRSSRGGGFHREAALSGDKALEARIAELWSVSAGSSPWRTRF